MDFKVIFKSTFVTDLERIVKSIAIHNPNAARTLGETMINSAESLCMFPERHPQVRQRPGIRRILVKETFKIFYRVKHESHTVEILRCWDARQQFDPDM